MSKYVDWEDLKAELRASSPLSDAEYEAAEAMAKERHQAYLRGYQLAEMRKTAQMTQAEVARILGVTQARISKIESGEISGIENYRAYVAALGGKVETVATIGDHSWRVA
ncbi:helix-turn-helix domain-containing protein [Glycomyces sp. NPDC021274]|uniref:helix-turn-helix domain-containing protein n=1 Tax=Glycomyces sp. NPDC021274 TaxID=3155120 RepID=UPI00340B2030